MADKSRRRLNRVDLSGDRRSVTCTYRYGREVRTTVAQDVPAVHAKARRLWGEPDAVASLSTPRSIYNDLTGFTRNRTARTGMQGHGAQGVVQ